MPALQNNAWFFLVRQTPLTEEEWYGLLEARRLSLLPYLNSFTLRKLGDALIGRRRRDGAHLRMLLRENNPLVVADKGLSLDTQGIFSDNVGEFKDREGEPTLSGLSWGRYKAFSWGLTRSGAWVLIEIEYETKRFVGEEVQRVSIRKANPRIIIAEGASGNSFRIWRELGQEVRRWYRSRLQLYQEAEKLLIRVKEEETGVSWVPKPENWAEAGLGE